MFQTGAQVTDKAVDGILQRIDSLSVKIGTTAAHVWDVYVQQARVEAIRDTVFVVLLLIVSYLLGYLSYRLFRHGIKRDNYGNFLCYRKCRFIDCRTCDFLWSDRRIVKPSILGISASHG
jgi:hypothetical protein